MAGSDLSTTLNVSGQKGASPREYNSHQRYSALSRRRHDDQTSAFLTAQATRLSTTTAIVFAKVKKYGAAHVKAAANLAALP